MVKFGENDELVMNATITREHRRQLLELVNMTQKQVLDKIVEDARNSGEVEIEDSTFAQALQRLHDALQSAQRSGLPQVGEPSQHTSDVDSDLDDGNEDDEIPAVRLAR